MQAWDDLVVARGFTQKEEGDETPNSKPQIPNSNPQPPNYNPQIQMQAWDDLVVARGFTQKEEGDETISPSGWRALVPHHLTSRPLHGLVYGGAWRAKGS